MSQPLLRPFVGSHNITQGFGPTAFAAEPAYKEWAHFHRGVDYALPLLTPVLSSAEGRVVFAGWDDTGFGNTVVVEYGNGLTSRVAHLSHISVEAGQGVATNTQLGLSGSTGNSTGPHLHWQLECYGAPIHPWYVSVARP